jgi:Plant transposon protein
MRWDIPPFPIFDELLLVPDIANGIFLSERQEGARKAAERLFGVLFKKWAILYRPSRLWHVEDTEIILKACIILHNMSCEERRETFTGSRATRMTLDSNPLEAADDIPIILPPDALEDPGEASAFWRSHLSGVEYSTQHLELKEALQKYMWTRRK